MERLAIMREQFFPELLTRKLERGDSTSSIFGFLKAATLRAAGGDSKSLLSESECRELWEVPAWEELLVFESCSASSRTGSGATRRGQLFVFEDTWIFAVSHHPEARNRCGYTKLMA